MQASHVAVTGKNVLTGKSKGESPTQEHGVLWRFAEAGVQARKSSHSQGEFCLLGMKVNTVMEILFQK